MNPDYFIPVVTCLAVLTFIGLMVNAIKRF